MVCMDCLKKQQRINELEEELAGVKAKLRYQERTAQEGPFKSSTPRSKIPVKPNSLPERQAKKGDAKPQHPGAGRSAISPEQADREEIVGLDRLCPQCREEMRYKGTKPRSVTDYERGRLDRTLYQQEVYQCPCCKKVYMAQPPGVFSRSHYGNGLLTHVAVEHYLFGRTLGPLLATAMELRKVETNETAFRKRATQIVSKIKQTIHAEAHHPAIQKIQNIFREHEDRLYHWARDRTIPAENNLAERDLRSLVIARKNRFGSQSDQGSRTREILMTVLHTLKKRGKDVYGELKSALDRIAADSTVDPYTLLFEPNSS